MDLAPSWHRGRRIVEQGGLCPKEILSRPSPPTMRQVEHDNDCSSPNLGPGPLPDILSTRLPMTFGRGGWRLTFG